MTYEPIYQWRMTKIDRHFEESPHDWSGFDGPHAIGRVRKDQAGPTKGKWQWAAWLPEDFKGRTPMPHNGFVATARIATQMVEEYWQNALVIMSERS